MRLVVRYWICAVFAPLGLICLADADADLTATKDLTELDAVTVTATRSPTVGYDAPNAITVVTPKEMARRMSFGIIDALTDEPGLFTQRTTNGHGSPIIRGFTGYHTLMLVDGVRLNNTTYRSGPNQYFNTIDVLGADRIEVVRGPSTVLYGNASLGGVINVLSRRPDRTSEALEVRPRVFARYGSSGSNVAGGIGLSGGQKDLSFDLSINRKTVGDVQPGRGRDVHVDGRKYILTSATADIPATFRVNGTDYTRSVTYDAETPTDYQESAANLDVDVRLSHNQSVRFAYQGVQQVVSSRWDKVGSREEFAIHEYSPQDRHLGYVSYRAESPIHQLDSLSATLSFHRQVEGTTLVPVGNDPTTTETRDATNTLGASITATTAISPTNRVTVGADVYHDTVASSQLQPSVLPWGTYPDGSTALDINLFAENRTQVSQALDLTIGGALTSYNVTSDLTFVDPSFGVLEKSGTAGTGTAAIGFEAIDGVKLFGAAGTGFRAPNLSDLSAVRVTNQSVSAPSPDVEPETSVKFEAGVKVRRSSIGASVTVFQTNLNDSYISRPATEVYGDDLPQYIRSIQQRYPDVSADEISVTVGVDKSVLRGVEANVQVTPAASVTIYGVGNVVRGEVLTINGNDPDPDKPWETRIRREPPINGTIGVRVEPLDHNYWGEVFVRGAMAQRRLSEGDVRDPRIPGFTRNVADVEFDDHGNAIDAGTPGFATLNVRAGVLIAGMARFTAAVENIFDRRYRWHGSGVDAPGRNFLLSVDHRF